MTDPIQTLRNYVTGDTDVIADLDETENALKALTHVAKLVQAAQAADTVLFEHMPEWYGDSEWPELDKLRAALAPFKEAP